MMSTPTPEAIMAEMLAALRRGIAENGPAGFQDKSTGEWNWMCGACESEIIGDRESHKQIQHPADCFYVMSKSAICVWERYLAEHAQPEQCEIPHDTLWKYRRSNDAQQEHALPVELGQCGKCVACGLPTDMRIGLEPGDFSCLCCFRESEQRGKSAQQERPTDGEPSPNWALLAAEFKRFVADVERSGIMGDAEKRALVALGLFAHGASSNIAVALSAQARGEGR